MKNRLSVAATALSCMVGCSSGGIESDQELGSLGQEIVRADKEGGPRAAVAVVGLTIFGGHRYCSGVVVAPRVVVTAAHCLTSIVERTVVYYGDDVLADQAEFGSDDDPSRPWSVAESWSQHPDYVADLHFPDLAVVYTPRELPIEPARLARAPLRDRDIGESLAISGWGASLALSPDLSSFEGIGVQRTARVPFLGSPTEADFVAEDPNNGLFVPEIRARLAKFDGTAPESNSCAGDSGAPIYTLRHGRLEVRAINFFTGLSCEGYSMATRVEPFLDYFDDAIGKGGELPVEPELRCVDEASDGSLTAYFGYDNHNAVTIEIPFGRDNRLRGDDAEARPTRFLPGHHPWDIFVDFSPRERLEWVLRSGPGCKDRDQMASASRRSPRCDGAAPETSCARVCRAFAACQLDFGDCMPDCVGNIPFFEAEFPQCLEPYSALNRCFASLPTEDLCDFGDPPSCVEETAAFEACFNQ